ncbi:hypothetical protein [Parahaliea mediterranea]|uniref:hypothetical protein n=1 Tax=Parahaliea mediterranea TaxID=651086 RepID=UPI0013009D85|nr:hypothetical protein [Parahaliea mediterranea]
MASGKLAAVLLFLPCFSFGQSTRYEYTGAPVERIDAGTAYVTGAVVTGFIETTSPLPANLVDVDIGAQISDWSFNDTVNTVAAGAGIFYDALGAGPQLIVSTDATGNIVSWNFFLYSPLPHSHDAPIDRMWLSFVNSRDELVNDAPCRSFPAADTPCSSLLFGRGYSRASSLAAGQWQIIPGGPPVVPPDPPVEPPVPLSPRAVPTLSPAAIALLVGLVCVLGGVRGRKLW